MSELPASWRCDWVRLAGLILDDSGLSGWAGKALAGWGAGEGQARKQ